MLHDISLSSDFMDMLNVFITIKKKVLPSKVRSSNEEGGHYQYTEQSKVISPELGNMRKTVEEKVDEKAEGIIECKRKGRQILTKREAEVTAESGTQVQTWKEVRAGKYERLGELTKVCGF